MGLYLNIGNQNFAEFSRTQYFVDKSQLINKLLKKDITEKFVCNSRARRFGKSVTADMLVAYFSKGADSRHLFAPLKCVKDALFLESMNAYDTIFVDIQAQFKEAEFENEEPNRYISRKIVRELQTEYADIELGEMSMMNALSTIYDKKGSRFVIIFDEWDYPIREFGEEDPHRRAYTELLRGLFKNNAAKSYIRLAYLPGIMPIVRTKGQSAVNNFVEYTMTNPMDLAQDIGFTEEEVFSLCERAGVDFEQMKEWY
ncbi:MAG: AAA family ATPase, partial [Lachnospiraceae bacterium]|nr:AAA family ATPase [Lachnospiraceae bacterium]